MDTALGKKKWKAIVLEESFNNIDGLESLSSIKEGLYKDTYRCVYKGRKAILSQYRIDKNCFNLDPKREASLLRGIEKSNLAPDVLFYDDQSKIIISEEIDGEIFTGSEKREFMLSGLAKSLATLHSYRIDSFEHTFQDSLNFYREHISDDRGDRIFDKATELYSSLYDRDGIICVCHNDLHPENILIGKRIQFIDWEYASLNLPSFDIAYVIEHFGLAEKEIMYFLSEYGFNHCDGGLEALELARKLTRYTTLIWLLILNKYYTMNASETKLMTSLIKELKI